MNERAAYPHQEALQSAWQLARLSGWSYTVATRRFSWSPEAETMFRLSEGERTHLTLTGFLGHIHPEDRNQFVQIIELVVEKGLPSFRYHYRLNEDDGECKFIVGHAQCDIDASGKVQRVYGTIMDVTEHERRRQAAELTNVRMRAITTTGKVWWWEQDSELRFTTLSGTNDHQLTTWLASHIGRRRWEIPDAEPCVGTWADHRCVVEARQPFQEFEYRVRERYFSITGLPVHSPDGQFLGYRGTASNITAQKQAEAAARDNLTLLRLASRLGRVGAWAVELPSMKGSWSTELFDIYELPPDAPLTTEMLLSLVEPSPREAVRTALRQCRVYGSEVDIQFRSLTCKGAKVWLRLTAEAVRDARGAIIRTQGAVQDITDRKQDEVQLRHLSTELLNTFESITDAFITVDTDLRLTYANREAERLTKFRRDELIGQRIADLFPSFRDSAFHAELTRVRNSGMSGRAEAFFEPQSKWLNVTLYPSRSGLTLMVRDVTESRKAQRALAVSEERYRLLFETSSDGIVKVGPDGKISNANRAACKMFGRTVEQMCALESTHLVVREDARVTSMIAERLGTGGALGELTMVRHDGSTFEAEVSTSMYTSRAGETTVNLVVRDATERARLRRKLEALNEELGSLVRERTIELEQANSELKAFARSLAHDLRQPVAGARALGVALADALRKCDVESATRYAAQIVRATETMNEYVEALLSLARISQTSLQIEEVDLSAIATALVDELKRQSPHRLVTCTIEPEMYADGDATLLRMLLQNLLANAFKFTAMKSQAQVFFSSELAPDGRTVYGVRDNGAGFDSAQAHRLFGTFQRLHRQADFPGMGIGLANAKRIVERHGGAIWAESRVGRGASFMFTLGEHSGATR